MEWWQALLILAIVVAAISLVYSMRVGRDENRGQEVDRGVSGNVSKHKITANPIFWAFIIFTLIVFVVTVYYIFVDPEGAY